MAGPALTRSDALGERRTADVAAGAIEYRERGSGPATGGAVSQALVGRRADRVGRLVLTSCDAFENYPPKAVAYLKTVARVRPAFWLLIQSMRLRAAQRLPIAYGWATHRPIERATRRRAASRPRAAPPRRARARTAPDRA